MNLTSTYLPRYTNYTMISGEPTLQPQDMYDKWNNPNKPGKKFMKKVYALSRGFKKLFVFVFYVELKSGSHLQY